MSPAVNPCSFNICKASSHICRIRLDFSTFAIAGPTAGTAIAAVANSLNGPVVGDCSMDTFSVTSPGNTAPPVICGFNSGQHMIVDASNECNKAIFDFDGTTTSREFDIKVTQYNCGDENGGPDGCLQYFTGNTGTFASYNFPTNTATVGDSATHLSNQCYTMCFRQELGKCAICFTVAIVGGDATMNQASFGLSLSPGAAAIGTQDTSCSLDYLQIPGAERDGVPAADMFEVGTVSAIVHERICGRFFGFAAIAGADGATINTESICTQQRPFRVVFKTDADESNGADGANTNEQTIFPGGIIGFQLNYALQDC